MHEDISFVDFSGYVARPSIRPGDPIIESKATVDFMRPIRINITWEGIKRSKIVLSLIFGGGHCAIVGDHSLGIDYF